MRVPENRVLVGVGRSSLLVLLTAIGVAAGGCRDDGHPLAGREVAVMHLPEGEAGRVIARGIEAAGGWDRWRAHRDVTFVSTLAIFDPAGRILSESIFLHRQPTRGGWKTRVDSIGLAEEVVFGFDGRSDWMLRGGKAVTALPEMAFTRFHALTSLYWFHLPFMLAEPPRAATPGAATPQAAAPLKLSYEGSGSLGGKRWEKVRADFGGALPPIDWLVLYFDAETGLLDRVLASVRAEFLDRRLWVGRWLDYREVDGLRKERRRAFYPASARGRIVGPLAAEQLIEHVRFDNGLPDHLFEPPLRAAGGAPAG